MRRKSIRGEWLLLLCAIIWGSGFIAQRQAMQSFGPFTFNCIRFLLGALVLALYISLTRRKSGNPKPNELLNPPEATRPPADSSQDCRQLTLGSLVCGFALFLGSTLQQYGLITTEAGKAGFITTLYIVFVAIFGIFFGKKADLKVWLAIIISMIGFYFLSIKKGFSIAPGDLIVFIGSIVWACHILLIDHFSPRTDSLKLACGQFLVTGVLAGVFALIKEHFRLPPFSLVWWAPLYAGFIVVGIAFTLQVLGQVGVKPSVSALILSLEAVFAALFGILILNERLTPRESLGCLLVAIAVLLVQVKLSPKPRQTASTHR